MTGNLYLLAEFWTFREFCCFYANSAYCIFIKNRICINIEIFIIFYFSLLIII